MQDFKDCVLGKYSRLIFCSEITQNIAISYDNKESGNPVVKDVFIRTNQEFIITIIWFGMLNPASES